MLRHCLIAILAARCLLVSALGADAARLSHEEQTAFHVRKIQTELMVAALSCKHRFYRNQYDNFVLTYQSQLVNYGGVLRRYFARRYGSGSTGRLDKYITAIANQASLRAGSRLLQPRAVRCRRLVARRPGRKAAPATTRGTTRRWMTYRTRATTTRPSGPEQR